MRDDELDLLHNAELKEAFDEFDKVEQFCPAPFINCIILMFDAFYSTCYVIDPYTLSL